MSALTSVLMSALTSARNYERSSALVKTPRVFIETLRVFGWERIEMLPDGYMISSIERILNNSPKG